MKPALEKLQTYYKAIQSYEKLVKAEEETNKEAKKSGKPVPIIQYNIPSFL